MIEDLLDDNFLKGPLLTVHQQMVRRIFDEGKDATGAPIGEYSEEYIKRRAKSGLGTSPKVILQFTGQMRNDYQLLQDGDHFASGFTNSANGNKSFWVEDTYNKSIFALTEREEKLLNELINKKVDDALNR